MTPPRAALPRLRRREYRRLAAGISNILRLGMLGHVGGMIRRLAARAWALGAALVAAGTLVAAAGTASAGAGAAPPIAGCAFGSEVPGLTGFYARAVDEAAGGYLAGLGATDAATRARARQIFEAAAAAYVYGLPQVVERGTVKHFPRNEIVSVAALANPQVQTVVAPNVDTAYTVAWLDLTSGPMVINVPDTGQRFYTFQFLDAFTNAFSYLGTGSTGTRAGAYALVPPGYTGTLPAGLTRIDAPSNTVWLLGRTLVQGPSDLPAVKRVQQGYEATPLSAWEAGTRQPPVVFDSYPPTIPKSVPTGPAFIAELNREMTVDPPLAADDCALRAMAPAGVQVPHPTPAQSLLADLSDEAPPLPAVAADPVASAAISAGTAAAVSIIAAGDTALNASSRAANNGWEIPGSWVGAYGTRYLGRAIVATNLLGANTPQQTIYPIADTDFRGRPLNGAYRYTIRFPRGALPPVNAFWSVTMYNSAYFLYANQIDRYAIGDRTQGLSYGSDGSLTLYVQHDEPAGASQRANWLPAPAGPFHLILRLYQPKAAALAGVWKPPPVLRSDESLRPMLTGLRVSPRSFRPARRGAVTRARRGPGRVSYSDSQAVLTRFVILALSRRRHCRARPARSCRVERAVVRFSRPDLAGANRFFLTGRAWKHALRRGRYLLRAVAGGSGVFPRSVPATAGFRIR